MRSSIAVVVLALAASASPAFAIPLRLRDTTSSTTPPPASKFNAPTTPPVDLSFPDQSGAGINLGLIKDIVSIGGGIISGAQGIKNFFSGKKREELEALFSRELSENPEAGAILLQSLHHVLTRSDDYQLHRREFDDLVTRALAEDESGAISISAILKGLSGIFHKRDDEFQLQRRELGDLIARAVAEDESGAISFGTILNVGSAIVNGLSSIFHKRDEGFQQQRRELEELMARAIAEDESGAISFGTILNVGSAIVNGLSSIFHKRDDGFQQQRREFEDLMARAIAEDESGAISLGTILNVGSAIVNGISSFFHKREFDESITRLSAKLAGSGAHTGAQDHVHILPFVSKREELGDIVAREVEPNLLAHGNSRVGLPKLSAFHELEARSLFPAVGRQPIFRVPLSSPNLRNPVTVSRSLNELD